MAIYSVFFLFWPVVLWFRSGLPKKHVIVRTALIAGQFESHLRSGPGSYSGLYCPYCSVRTVLSDFTLILYANIHTPPFLSRYSLPDHIETSRVWVLKNSIRVKRTTNCTYNCVVGWGPGGTSGLQQVGLSLRYLI